MEADFACGTQKMPTEFSFLGRRPTLLLLSLMTAATSSWAAPALTPAQAAANLTAPDLAPLRRDMGLNRQSVVLLISTEGDTDPVHYQKVMTHD